MTEHKLKCQKEFFGSLSPRVILGQWVLLIAVHYEKIELNKNMFYYKNYIEYKSNPMRGDNSQPKALKWHRSNEIESL